RPSGTAAGSRRHSSRPGWRGAGEKVGGPRRGGGGGGGGGGPPADGQHEPEGRRSIGRVERPDAAPVRFDDGATDREPQPRATSLRARTSIELFEDAILLAGGEPGPAVSHLDDGVAILGPGTHVYLRARRRVLGRVLQQVDEHLLDQAV